MPNDDELIARHLSGDEEAFPLLVGRHLDPVYRIALRILGAQADAEDAVQETFLKAWRNIRKFRRGENFRTWLLRIARNSAIDMLRKRRDVSFSQFEQGATDEFADSLPDTDPLPDEIAARVHDADELKQLLQKLSSHDQEVLTLRYQEVLSFREIGEILAQPLDTVKSRHRRALLALKALIAPKRPPHT